MLGQRGIAGLCHPITQGIVQMYQLVCHWRLLWPRRVHASTSPTLPGLDHIGHADAKPLGHRPCRKMIQRKNPIPQILRISLTTTPRHQSLRLQPETYESHQFASLKHKNAIPPSAEPL